MNALNVNELSLEWFILCYVNFASVKKKESKPVRYVWQYILVMTALMLMKSCSTLAI